MFTYKYGLNGPLSLLMTGSVANIHAVYDVGIGDRSFGQAMTGSLMDFRIVKGM